MNYKHLLVIVGLLTAFGCGGGEKTPSSSSPSPSPSASAITSSEPSPSQPQVAVSGSPSPSASATPAQDQSSEDEEKDKKSPLGEQSLEGTSLSAKGDNPWDLKCNRIDFNDATKKAVAIGATWNLLDKAKKTLMVVEGQKAHVNVETQGVEFEGPVKAKGAKGEEITVQRLVWDNQKRKIYGSGGVRIVRQGSVMTGDKMEASPDLKTVQVSGNVKVFFPSAEDKAATAQGQSSWEGGY